jgi:hypothetical protein
LLVIGRQVRTPYGKYIDLLGMDAEGNLHVLELKRDKTPRDVVAQALDYGSWVTTLDRDAVIEIANHHLGRPTEGAFEDVFGSSLPDELNGGMQLTIIATELDPSSERIVTYLRDFDVPINVAFFSFMDDDDRRYLARSWLVSPDDNLVPAGRQRGSKGKRADWNGRDWFVSFGDGDNRSWLDALAYGFVSAGGDVWYSRTLRALPVGARVNVHIPKIGYVGVGKTLAEAEPFSTARVEMESGWQSLSAQTLHAKYRHVDSDQLVTPENDEYVVPVRWYVANPKEQAFWQKGMFANQNSACKLRQEFTIERLAQHFRLEDQDA